MVRIESLEIFTHTVIFIEKTNMRNNEAGYGPFIKQLYQRSVVRIQSNAILIETIVNRADGVIKYPLKWLT